MYANAQNMLFSHMWLITVSDVSGCHAVGTVPLKKLKARISFNINNRSSMGRANESVAEKCKTISSPLFENL